MEIGYLIKQHRQNYSLTLREFANRCGTSHSYIAMLESGKNSKTGEPIVPTITMLKKIADGMAMPLNDLIALCDDMPVTLSNTENSPTEPKLSEGEEMLIKLFRQLPDESQKMYLEVLRATLKDKS